MKITKMRVPTNKEYNKLCDITGEDNRKMFWEDMNSVVDRGLRGGLAARHWRSCSSGHPGFRPAFETTDFDGLSSDALEGKEPVVIGTLYMDEAPIRISGTLEGTVSYQSGTKLTIREPLADSSYQVLAYHVGSGVFVADRVLIRKIGRDRIKAALTDSAKVWMRLGVTFDFTPEEVMAILSNGDKAEQIIRKAIREGRSRLDGNSYIPAAAIEDYNRKFGTVYQETDIEFEI